MLRWLDIYPCAAEVKGGQVALACTQIYITSNINPRDWYKDADAEQRDALMRRLSVIHFSREFNRGFQAAIPVENID